MRDYKARYKVCSNMCAHTRAISSSRIRNLLEIPSVSIVRSSWQYTHVPLNSFQLKLHCSIVEQDGRDIIVPNWDSPFENRVRLFFNLKLLYTYVSCVAQYDIIVTITRYFFFGQNNLRNRLTITILTYLRRTLIRRETAKKAKNARYHVFTCDRRLISTVTLPSTVPLSNVIDSLKLSASISSRQLW